MSIRREMGFRSAIVIVVVALSFASPWDVPYVRAENLEPHPPILINGNGGFTTENGVTGGSGTASDPYIIEGWLIEGFGIEIRNTNVHFEIRNVDAGEIVLETIANGSIESSTVSSLGILFSTNVKVLDNQVFVGRSGEGEVGIGVGSSANITISRNAIRQELGYPTGIFFNDDFRTKNVTVSNNIITGFWFGIDTQSVGGPITISGNEISGNVYGIQVGAGGGSSHTRGLLIYHNNFISNRVHAYFWETGGIAFSWDTGYAAGGNYWEGYSGMDQCSGSGQNICPSPDGIGDTPYAIPINCYLPCVIESSWDRYPLMRPFAQPVLAAVKFNPSSIALSSQGRYLAALVELPEGFKVSEIILSSIRLTSTIEPTLVVPVTIVSLSGAQVLLVKFNMEDVKTLLPKPDNNGLQVSGNMLTSTNFRHFAASATVHVFSKVGH